MMTVNEMSKRTGVSARTLHYYDQIGLLKPEAHTAGGYRLYGEKALERLGCILTYRELQFPLQSIAAILDSPSFDRNRALRQQIELLEMQKEHLETLILMARGVLMKGTEGGYLMNFTAFDTAKLDTYAKKARETWQHTPAWQEYEEKHKDATGEQKAQEAEALMELFRELGMYRASGPEAAEVQTWVGRLQSFISAHMYHCTDQILSYLGEMYGGGGEFQENIDKAGGTGTGVLARDAVRLYLKKKEAQPDICG